MTDTISGAAQIDKRLDRVADKLSALDELDPSNPDYLKAVRNQVLVLTGLVRSVLDRTIFEDEE